jgi:hypothetical protein
MMWLMTRKLYLKFEINTLRNKELIVKKPKKLESEILMRLPRFVKYDSSQYTPYSQDQNYVYNFHTTIYPYFKFHKKI